MCVWMEEWLQIGNPLASTSNLHKIQPDSYHRVILNLMTPSPTHVCNCLLPQALFQLWVEIRPLESEVLATSRALSICCVQQQQRRALSTLPLVLEIQIYILIFHAKMAASLSSSVSSLQSSLNLLESATDILDAGVSDFPRLCKVLQTTRVRPTLARHSQRKHLLLNFRLALRAPSRTHSPRRAEIPPR